MQQKKWCTHKERFYRAELNSGFTCASTWGWGPERELAPQDEFNWCANKTRSEWEREEEQIKLGTFYFIGSSLMVSGLALHLNVINESDRGAGGDGDGDGEGGRG